MLWTYVLGPIPDFNTNFPFLLETETEMVETREEYKNKTIQ